MSEKEKRGFVKSAVVYPNHTEKANLFYVLSSHESHWKKKEPITNNHRFEQSTRVVTWGKGGIKKKS
jgi:hypothetical protein